MGKWLSALKWLVVAVVLAVFIGLLIKWNRKGGISVEVGFDDRIELTSQEIRRIEQIGQWEFLSVQSEVVADTLRKGSLPTTAWWLCTPEFPASGST